MNLIGFVDAALALGVVDKLHIRAAEAACPGGQCRGIVLVWPNLLTFTYACPVVLLNSSTAAYLPLSQPAKGCQLYCRLLKESNMPNHKLLPVMFIYPPYIHIYPSYTSNI